jgi:hypothetical protein
MTFRRVDPRIGRIEPVAGVVKMQDPVQAHVTVGVGKAAVVHRKGSGPCQDDLAEHQTAERDEEEPAEGVARPLDGQAVGARDHLEGHQA